MVSASDVAVDKRLYFSRQSESVVKSAYVSVTTDRRLDCIVRTLNYVFLNSFAVFSLISYRTLDDGKYVYPNVHTVLHIFTTLPVSTAEPERMFSKVDLTLSDIRSTMSEDRLEALVGYYYRLIIGE